MERNPLLRNGQKNPLITKKGTNLIGIFTARSTNLPFCNMTSDHTVYFLVLVALCGTNSGLLLALGILILIK